MKDVCASHPVKILKQHPLSLKLERVISNEAKNWNAWTGHAFRSVNLGFAHSTVLLDGEGAIRNGGRWTPPSQFRAVNLSLDAHTSLQECHARAAYYKFSKELLRPMLVVAVRFHLHTVFDLRSFPKSLTVIIAQEELLTENWRKFNDLGFESISQAIARISYSLGAEAILAPSAVVSTSINLIFFPQNQQKQSVVVIEHQDELDELVRKKS